MPVLYLIPSFLSDDIAPSQFFSLQNLSVIHSLRQFVVEDLRAARRFLSKAKHPEPIDNLQFRILNEHTPASEIAPLLPYLKSADTGVLSEAGIPCVADPGASIVRLSHANGITVVPLTGPSSIFLALMASGLNGQSFSFVGYLPVKKNERRERLKFLELRSRKENQTQIFIETPYRNMQLIDDILDCCHAETMLCIAAGITGANEFIRTRSIVEWRRKRGEELKLNKIPAVFLMQAF